MLSHDFYGRPIYSDDTIHYISPWKLERMRDIEEQRRCRAALEYAYRERERAVQEQECQKQVLKYRQQQEEDWKRRRQQQQLLRQQQQHQQQQPPGPELQYRIVLGPDGYLYRIPINPETMKSSETEELRKARKTSPSVGYVNEKTESLSVSPSLSSSVKIVMNDKNNRFDTTSNDEGETPGTPKADNTTKKNIKVKGNVVVEDVSDSESEDDDDWKSIWRNRLPSPGEWMEPVPNLS